MADCISRREALIGGAAAIATAIVPDVVSIIEADPEIKILPAWAVGTPGEFDWQCVTGRTADEAIRNFMCQEFVGGDGCEAEDGEDCDFGCEWCSKIGGLEAERKTVWDGKTSTTPADWINANMGTICSRCSYETFREEGAHAVGDEAVCSDCMTLADWDVVDPEQAAEARAQMVTQSTPS